MSSPPPPPSQPPSPSGTIVCENVSECLYFDVSDTSILISLSVFTVLAALLLLLFGKIRTVAPIFFGRRRLRNLVRSRPVVVRAPT